MRITVIMALAAVVAIIYGTVTLTLFAWGGWGENDTAEKCKARGGVPIMERNPIGIIACVNPDAVIMLDDGNENQT